MYKILGHVLVLFVIVFKHLLMEKIDVLPFPLLFIFSQIAWQI